MSSRVTRSSARKQADLSLSSLADNPATPTASSSSSRKRKIPTSTPDSPRNSPPPPKATKRQKKSAQPADEPPDLIKSKPKSKTMSSSKPPPDDTSTKSSETPTTSSKKKSGKAKKSSPDQAAGGSNISNKRTRAKKIPPKEEEPSISNEPEKGTKNQEARSNSSASSGNDTSPNDEEAMDYDPFSGSSGFLGRHGGAFGMPAALRALSGAMSGSPSKLRAALENLKQKDDISARMSALSTICETLLVSTEDQLAGQFQPDVFVKEFIAIMEEPCDYSVEDNELAGHRMLLACRCIANLIEAFPAATPSVVYGGAVPVLVSKLSTFDFADLAEQALTTLKKISSEFPSSIVREGGLTACLQFLEFFPTSTQRTAVTTAANCCRSIPHDSFTVVKDVMPNLKNVLNGSDQVVVEQGCLCISRIVESFRRDHHKLEELMTPEMLQAILRLLIPGATNLVSAQIHTSFLRVLSITARASPALSAELLNMKVVDTLYQILTGVSPPDEADVSQKIDSVVVMQALIHRPREQVFESLNVICELLPDLDAESLGYLKEAREAHKALLSQYDRAESDMKSSSQEERKTLLSKSNLQLRRFAIILFPTLTDAYSSTVNLHVRERVLNAQLKMLSTLDTSILEDALRSVPYASFLASIFSQQDHPLLTAAALQAAKILLNRLESIYRYQFHREGVIAEVKKLAERPKDLPKSQTATTQIEMSGANNTTSDHPVAHVSVDVPTDSGDEDMDDVVDEEDMADELDYDHDEDDSDHSSDSEAPVSPNEVARCISIQNKISDFARDFLRHYETSDGKQARQQAGKILDDLSNLVAEIADCYENGRLSDGAKKFAKLARYFDGDALESITSYELLSSKAVTTLLDLFEDVESNVTDDARSAFIEVFMGNSIRNNTGNSSIDSSDTPFSVLIHKLQDLLSRSEHFEVLTVHQGTSDRNAPSETSMLAKQIKIKLVADDSEKAIPSPYRSLMVSIHAIANFKSLDEYLRPRISLAEHPPRMKNRESSGASSSQRERLLAGLEGLEGLPTRNNPANSTAATSSAKESESRPSSRKASKAKDEGSDVKTPSGENAKFKRSSNKVSDDSNTGKSPETPAERRSAMLDAVLQAQLECADEARLSDDDEEMDETDGMGSIIDEFEEEVNDEQADPSAVNMEVASTGKVVAREENGTRITTPHAQSMTRPVSSRPPFPSGFSRSLLSFSARPMSYSAAVQAPPTDWHLQFSVNGQDISSDTTVYRAVHSNFDDTDGQSGTNAWSRVHTINFRRVPGPAPTESSISTSSPTSSSFGAGLPQSLEKNSTTATILRLLLVLHEMNANLDDVLANDRSISKLQPEPLSSFVNTKLTAKMNRQLEEPLIVASNCLPNWSEDLARLYPFLFPFETRHLFLQSTSFGYSRSMARWQNAQNSNESRRDRHRDERQFLGRLQRQKVRISRTRILESAVKVMDLYAASSSILEVEYFEEVGTGLGPTLEFYSVVSKEFCRKKLQLWRENESNEKDDYVFANRGLFPAPMTEQQASSGHGKKILVLFNILGKFVARSMLDSRMIDLPFNLTFFRINTSAHSVKPSLGAVKTVDEDLARSLQMLKQFSSAKKKIMSQDRLTASQKAHKISNIQVGNANIDDLGLDFTLPGYPSIELIKDGANTSVTIENVGQYVDKVVDYTLGSGVRRQIEAFRAGFSQVFPYTALKAFTPDELVMLFGRVDEDWSMETLMDSIKADHGYTLDSRSVRNLLQAMSELSVSSRRDFLQFVTGSPKLPIGGFKSLTPMFTVVLRPSEPGHVADEYLPSCMTCVNYLKLPDYSSLDVMREKLGVAIREGQGAFHLS